MIEACLPIGKERATALLSSIGRKDNNVSTWKDGRKMEQQALEQAVEKLQRDVAHNARHNAKKYAIDNFILI